MNESGSDMGSPDSTRLSIESSRSGKNSNMMYRLYNRQQEKVGHEKKHHQHHQSIVPMKMGNFDGFERQGQAWFVATELQSDLVVELDDMKFHLHKFPLLSRSGRLNRLVFESRDSEKNYISLTGMPGGSGAFELAAKFCYGMAIDMTASNVAALRCAAEYLEMTEDLEEGNLISKAESFLSFVVLGSWKDSISVLQSCDGLSPWAENLQLVRRCSESIAWKACTDTRGISWSFIGRDTSGRRDQSPARVLDTTNIPPDWWFQDVLMLSVEHFVKVVAAIKVKGMRSDLMGGVITAYALKWVPGLSKDNAYLEAAPGASFRMIAAAGKDDFTMLQSRTQKLLENIVAILPLQQDIVSCSLLLRLLRIATMQGASASCRNELEKRIGMQLENAPLNDLLVPCFLHQSDTLYDVDLMQRLLQYFILQDQASPKNVDQLGYENAKVSVAKLLDGYLAEVARDPNLSLAKFQSLLEALPEYSRHSHDGLYRAIDTYLKVHPSLTEIDRKKLCRVMDCQKLSSEACHHASQNERLPLRVVVQVLFTEQLKLKNIVNGSDVERDVIEGRAWSNSMAEQSVADSGHGWLSTHQELKALKSEIQHLKEKLLDFHADYALVQEQLQKIIGPKVINQKEKEKVHQSPWTTGWKKLRRASNLFHRENEDTAADTPLVRKEFEFPKSRRRRNSLS